jgi:copper ion binding protein
MSQTLALNVPDMTCGHCKASVEKALGEIAGVQAVSVDLPNKKVAVQADDQVSVDTLVQALDEVGFTGEAA